MIRSLPPPDGLGANLQEEPKNSDKSPTKQPEKKFCWDSYICISLVKNVFGDEQQIMSPSASVPRDRRGCLTLLSAVRNFVRIDGNKIKTYSWLDTRTLFGERKEKYFSSASVLEIQ